MSLRQHATIWLAAVMMTAAIAVLAYVVATAVAQTTPGCVTVTPGVYVDLNNVTNAQTIAHERAAVANGQPRILHWQPDLATAHRALSLKGIPTRKGFDRDEYPPAATAEGGTGADVEYISPADNRSAGSRMRAQMSPFCAGQSFILEP
jgi:hypothetical protein